MKIGEFIAGYPDLVDVETYKLDCNVELREDPKWTEYVCRCDVDYRTVLFKAPLWLFSRLYDEWYPAGQGAMGDFMAADVPDADIPRLAELVRSALSTSTDSMKIWMVAGHADMEGHGKVFATLESAMDYVILTAYREWRLGTAEYRYGIKPIPYDEFKALVMDNVSVHGRDPEWAYYMWSGDDRFKKFDGWDMDRIGTSSWWTVTRVDLVNK